MNQYQASVKQYADGVLGSVRGDIARAGLPLRRRAMHGLGQVIRDGVLGNVFRDGSLGQPGVSFRDGSLGADPNTFFTASATTADPQALSNCANLAKVLIATSVVATGVAIWALARKR